MPKKEVKNSEKDNQKKTVEQRANSPTVANKLNNAKSAKPGRKNQRRSRKVKFSDPLSQECAYERPVSPKPILDAMAKTVAKQPASALDQLEPPFSLVAHLDIAAQKLNAREDGKNLADDKLETNKSSKSTKSGKSLKFQSVKSTVESRVVKKDKT